MYNRDYSEILGSSSRRFFTKGIGITLEMLDGHGKFVLNKRSESAGGLSESRNEKRPLLKLAARVNE